MYGIILSKCESIGIFVKITECFFMTNKCNGMGLFT